MSMDFEKIAFIGYGNMASGMAIGMKKTFPDLQIKAYDINPDVFLNLENSKENMKEKFIPVQSKSLPELCKWADVIVLSVKPANAQQALNSCKSELSGKILFSILAGVSVEKLLSYLALSKNDTQIKLLRLMPNLNAMIAQSASSAYFHGNFLESEKKSCTELMQALGSFIEIQKEELMHAATGLAGSGPAFVFAFIQAMAEGGVLAGFSYQDALELAIKTVSGSAKLLESTKEHPSVWRNKVTSAGGTTIEGLSVLENNAFHSSVMEAVKAAASKSEELGNKS